jgi:hypothetical protein
VLHGAQDALITAHGIANDQRRVNDATIGTPRCHLIPTIGYGVPIMAKHSRGHRKQIPVIININIKVGNKVLHSRFGNGIVIQMEGVGLDSKLTINFEGLGPKQILTKYAKMKLILPDEETEE